MPLISAAFCFAPDSILLPSGKQLGAYLRLMEQAMGGPFAACFASGAREVQCTVKKKKFNSASGKMEDMDVKDTGYKYPDYGFTGTVAVKDGGNGSIDFKSFCHAFFSVQSGILNSPPFKPTTLIYDDPEDISRTIFVEPPMPFLFGVIDHNSAHHMSWALAHHGLRQISGMKKVVINFDSHHDYHGNANSAITCGNWGDRLWELVGQTNKVTADVYVAIGLKDTSKTQKSGQFAIGQYTKIIKQKVNTYAVDTNKGTDVSAMMTTIEKNAGLSEPYAAYITADRDITRGSCTPYGDGLHDPAHVRAAVVNVINLLMKQKCVIVGFDVCGLPNAGKAKNNQEAGSAIADTLEDLQTYMGIFGR